MHFSQSVNEIGKHALGTTMVGVTAVIEKIVISIAPLPPSYFGPPAAVQVSGGWHG